MKPKTELEFGGQKYGSKDWRMKLALKMHRESNPQRLARVARGYSLRRLSEESGFHVEQLSRQERGSKDVFIYDLALVAKVLGVSPALMMREWLVWRTEYVHLESANVDEFLKKAIDLHAEVLAEMDKREVRIGTDGTDVGTAEGEPRIV